jgi:hypothetical protein
MIFPRLGVHIRIVYSFRDPAIRNPDRLRSLLANKSVMRPEPPAFCLL